MLLLSPPRTPPQAFCSFSAQRTAAGGRARRPMQAIAQAILEAGGAVFFQGLRAALYERLVGQPLPLGDQTAPAFGSGWPSQGGPLGGAGTACPTPEAVSSCPTVCLGVAVDVSGGVSPLLLATLLALLGATGFCSCLGGCCLAGVGARLWGYGLARARRALSAPAGDTARAPHPRALGYGPGAQAAARGRALSAPRSASSERSPGAGPSRQ